ncbi:BsuBI/PstI restriction endonuclease [Haloarcula quadrata]|uniref:BsuBI/PstI restriction endonuclease n=1 Tax=Haloarcula quadrata TaxID=182779 RepID=A0A495R463_9EURY|nr:BsuBI/PstI family type II restriction endonuclease [Haloarcula quadrata]RKS82111.1 BsuBI/PstI restriction endonuclease [Haloarcula quadrata]
MSTDDDGVNFDYDLTKEQLRETLKDFGLQESDVNGTMLTVLQAITSSDYYESIELRYDDLPNYAIQTTNIISFLDNYSGENSRESIRKHALKPLRDKAGVLGYDEPAPNSPKTHYWVSQEFREHLDNAELEETISEPDPVEGEDRIVDLPYYGEDLPRAPGEHTQLIADGLRELIPNLAEKPVLVHEGLTKEERSDIEGKLLPIKFGGMEFHLSVYPDALAYDEANQVLYLLEAVTSLGPFTDNRIETLLNDLSGPEDHTNAKEHPSLAKMRTA